MSSTNGSGNGYDDEDSAPPTPRTVNNRDLWKILTNLQITVNSRLAQIKQAVAEAPEPMSEEMAHEVADGLADVGHKFSQASTAVNRR